jgi:hypothetical protein
LPKWHLIRYASGMIRPLIIAAGLSVALLQPLQADVTGPNGKVQDCYCTDTSGSRVEIGQTICLYVDGRAFMAQCQMSLNVPMWRQVQDGCLSSKLAPSSLAPQATPRAGPKHRLRTRLLGAKRS